MVGGGWASGGWWGRGRECVPERRDMNHGVALAFKVWRLAFLRAVVAVLTSDDGCQAGNSDLR